MTQPSMKCDAAGAGVTLMIWVVALLIEGVFSKQLGEAGGFLLLGLGIIGVWFGVNVRAECRKRQSPPA